MASEMIMFCSKYFHCICYGYVVWLSGVAFYEHGDEMKAGNCK